jgi:hypothetical protein
MVRDRLRVGAYAVRYFLSLEVTLFAFFRAVRALLTTLSPTLLPLRPMT